MKKPGNANCYATFYKKADSAMNAVYSRLAGSLDSTGRENLRDEQRYWLRQRDRLLKEPGSNAGRIRYVEERTAVLATRNPADFASGSYWINPSGTYLLRFGNAAAPKSRFPSGKIRVEPAGEGRIFVHLTYDAGPPSNGLGIIKDTLLFNGEAATYTTQEDPSCRVVLHFGRNGIRVAQQSQAFSFGCGFGRNVHVDGFYERELLPANLLRIGEHRLGVQWLDHGKPGKAMVSKLSEDRYRITGRQVGESQDDYLNIDGMLTVVSARNLLFDGSILLKYAFINRGKECRREGRFHFTVPEGKKYWRLEEKKTCGDVTDYIDLFF